MLLSSDEVVDVQALNAQQFPKTTRAQAMRAFGVPWEVDPSLHVSHPNIWAEMRGTYSEPKTNWFAQWANRPPDGATAMQERYLRAHDRWEPGMSQRDAATAIGVCEAEKTATLGLGEESSLLAPAAPGAEVNPIKVIVLDFLAKLDAGRIEPEDLGLTAADVNYLRQMCSE